MFVFETRNIFLSQHVLHPWIKTCEGSMELNKFVLTTSKETETMTADRHILHANRLEYGVKLTAVKLCANNSLRLLRQQCLAILGPQTANLSYTHVEMCML